MVKPRERRAKVEPMSWSAEVESRAQRLKVKQKDQHSRAELETSKPKVDPTSWPEPLKEEPRG